MSVKWFLMIWKACHFLEFLLRWLCNVYWVLVDRWFVLEVSIIVPLRLRQFGGGFENTLQFPERFPVKPESPDPVLGPAELSADIEVLLQLKFRFFCKSDKFTYKSDQYNVLFDILVSYLQDVFVVVVPVPFPPNGIWTIWDGSSLRFHVVLVAPGGCLNLSSSCPVGV